jgi:hypothetical protein
MTNQIDILDLNDAINEAFGFESDDDFDLVQDDEYDVATEATAKGVTKKIFAVIMDVCRRIINAITRWVKNRSINKLVAFLKNKVAKFEDNEQIPIINKILDNNAKGLKKAKGAELGVSGRTGQNRFMTLLGIMDTYGNADGVVKLNAILRQLKSISIEKFGKEINNVKGTIGSDMISNVRNTGVARGAKPGNILSAIGDPTNNSMFVAYAGIMRSIALKGRLNITTIYQNVCPLTKAKCDIIGKAIKLLMEVISQFTLKTIRYYQSREDQWTMTKSQKAVITILKGTQQYVYDIIDVTNILLQDVKTDNFNEKDIDNESVSIDSLMYDMYNISTALESEVSKLADDDDSEI